MTGALTYLFLTRIKNQLKGLIKSPGKLLYVVFFAAIIGVTIWTGGQGDQSAGQSYRDIHELIAAVIALYTVIFAMIANNGFSNGASMFSLADVNLVFTAPLAARKVLFYGLIQQMGTSMLLGIFIFFQYGWIHGVYGISYPQLLIIFAGYVVTVFFAQVLAMVIYTFTSADEQKKGRVKIIFYGMIAAFAAVALFSAMKDLSNPIPLVVETVNNAWFKLLPVSGWMGGAVGGVLIGGAAEVFVGLGLSVLLLVLMIYLISLKKYDYYEDVLKSTEVSHSAITAKKEGRMAEVTRQNIKVGKTGFDAGFGADTFYYKHRIENRRSRVFLLSAMSLIFAAMIIAFSLFMRSVGIIAVFSFAVYMQIFTISLGRVNKELTKPFIYLVPEPPLSKLLYALRESMSGFVLEAIIIFLPVGLILGLGPVEIILSILARISFSILFTGGNLIVDRIWGGGSSKIFTMMLYFAVLLLLAAPGVILAVVLSTAGVFASMGENVPIFLSMIVCNIPVSLLAFYLCRNMLQYAELNNR